MYIFIIFFIFYVIVKYVFLARCEFPTIYNTLSVTHVCALTFLGFILAPLIITKLLVIF